MYCQHANILSTIIQIKATWKVKKVLRYFILKLIKNLNLLVVLDDKSEDQSVQNIMAIH